MAFVVELPPERSVSVHVCSKELETTVQGSHHSWLHVLKSQSVQQSAYQYSAQSSEDLSGEDLKELEAADDVLEYSSTDDEAEVNEVVNLIARGQKLAEEAKRKGNDISLQTTTVTLCNKGRSVTVNALGDSGSNQHAMDEELITELGLPYKDLSGGSRSICHPNAIRKNEKFEHSEARTRTLVGNHQLHKKSDFPPFKPTAKE